MVPDRGSILYQSLKDEAVVADDRQAMGVVGERLAEAALSRRGIRIVARRFAVNGGEIDLVARDRDTLVFVEVKCRRDRLWTEPQHAVNAAKQRRMCRAARAFIQARRLEHLPARFDIVAVVLPLDSGPEIEHFPDAFIPEKW